MAFSRGKTKLPSAVKACGSVCPIGDSNPCFCLERAASWAARRMGLLKRAELYQPAHAPSSLELPRQRSQAGS